MRLEDSVPELSGMNDSPLLFSKVKLDPSQSDYRQPRDGVLNRMSELSRSADVRLAWFKEKGRSCRCFLPHLKGWLHR